MDLIASLTEKLGIEGEQAEALAGAVLGGVKSQVAEKVGQGEADQLAAAIPELEGWGQKTQALTGGGGGGLFDAAASALGGGGGGLLGGLGGGGGADVAMVASVLAKLGLNESLATMVAPMALEFLKERLPDGLLQQVMGAVPMLTGGGDVAAAAASVLGGLFGKDG